MAYSSLGSLESIMRNQAHGSGHHASYVGPSLQFKMKTQFDLVDDDFEEPCSVLDLTQCISPPLPSDVWAQQQQAAMEYEQLQQQAQILWEQQQFFLWQKQQQQQQFWEQQSELQQIQNVGLGSDLVAVPSTWDHLQYTGEEEIQLSHGDPWMNFSMDIHQDKNLSYPQLQALPSLDEPFLFENWMAASGNESVSDESSSLSYFIADDHHRDSPSFSTVEMQQVSSGSRGFARQPESCTALDGMEEDQDLQSAMSNNFHPSTCVDIQSSMETFRPSSNWFLPIQQESLQSPQLETVNLTTQSRQCQQQPSPMISQLSFQFQSPNNVSCAPSETVNQQLQQQTLSNFVDEESVSEVTQPEPIALQPRRPAESSTSNSGGSEQNKQWGPHRPASHSLGSNEMSIHTRDKSESKASTMSRRRSNPDFMGDLNQPSSPGGHSQQLTSSPTRSKMGRSSSSNNNSIHSNSSSTESSGRGQSWQSISMTLAEVASGGVKMGGVELPTMGIQIPNVVRLNMETQAKGLGGVRMVQVLLACAEAVACRDSRQANILLQQLQHMASPYGDAMQRIASCFIEGLAARLAITGSQPFKFTNPPRKPPSEPEKLEGFNLVYRSSPYVAFGHFVANSALMEAFEFEETMHIVDLGMTHALQWPCLIHGLAKRPGGPPRLLRITGFGLETESMNAAGEELTRIARAAKVPFEFRCVTESLEGLKRSMLQLREGEALAVNSVLQLHCVVKESRGSLNAVLQSIHELSPKILTLVEQDASHNGPFFLGRFMEALHYYSAIFDSLDAILPRNSKQRVKMEQFHFAEEIKNIVSCEGPARVERHERVDQWRRRMSRAGFQPLPLKFLSQARMWLAMYSCEGYTLSEEKGCLVLGWRGKPIIAASSWKR